MISCMYFKLKVDNNYCDEVVVMMTLTTRDHHTRREGQASVYRIGHCCTWRRRFYQRQRSQQRCHVPLQRRVRTQWPGIHHLLRCRRGHALACFGLQCLHWCVSCGCSTCSPLVADAWNNARPSLAGMLSLSIAESDDGCLGMTVVR